MTLKRKSLLSFEARNNNSSSQIDSEMSFVKQFKIIFIKNV